MYECLAADSSFRRKNKHKSVFVKKHFKNKQRHGRSQRRHKIRNQSSNPTGIVYNRLVTRKQNNTLVQELEGVSTSKLWINEQLQNNDLYFSDNEMTQWQCEKCTYINLDDCLQCKICKNYRPNKMSFSRPLLQLNHFIQNPKLGMNDDWIEDIDNNLQVAIERSLNDDICINNNTTHHLKISHVSKNIKSKSQIIKFSHYWSNAQQSQAEILLFKPKKQSVKKTAAKMKKNTKTEEVEEKEGKMELQSAKKVFTTYLPTVGEILSNVRKVRSDTKWYIHSVLRSKFQQRFFSFVTEYRSGISVTYHGTHFINDQSIIQKGLLVGGKGIPIKHGAAYGAGVYCSRDMATAANYSSGSIYVCLATKFNAHGRICVVPKSKQILPCYLLSRSKEPPIQKKTKILPPKNQAVKLIPMNQTMVIFYPGIGPHNMKKKFRRIQRKWPSKKKFDD